MAESYRIKKVLLNVTASQSKLLITIWYVFLVFSMHSKGEREQIYSLSLLVFF